MASSKKKKMQECPPLSLLKEIERLVPHFDAEYAGVKREIRKGGIGWDESRCYVPVAISEYIISRSSHVLLASTLSMSLTAVMSWAQNRTIFALDESIAEALCAQVDDNEIPVEIFKRLPYQCIYIKTSYPLLYEAHLRVMDGFFAWIEHDYYRRTYELCIHGVERSGAAPFGLDMLSGTIPLLEGKTVSECLSETKRRLYEDKDRDPILSVISAEDYATFVNEWESHVRPALAQALQIVLYMCSNNAEKDYSHIIRKPATALKRPITVNDIQKIEVGVHEGAALRFSSPARCGNESGGGGWKVRPHVRRGHWHHYWTGSRKSNERTMVLHWIAPTLVNADSSTSLEAVERKVY